MQDEHHNIRAARHFTRLAYYYDYARLLMEQGQPSLPNASDWMNYNGSYEDYQSRGGLLPRPW